LLGVREMTSSPTLEEFTTAARREFEYLSSEFGFIEGPPTRNPFSVRYVSGDTEVVVEGINWGHAVNVLLRRGAETVPLWAIARCRGVTEKHPAGQLAQLQYDAKLLRRVAEEVLRHDFSVFPAASRVVAETMRK
jgi:hypothetical protein